MKDVIRISDKLADLEGHGTEYLVVNGIVLAVFENGNMRSENGGSKHDGEITLKAV